MSIVKYSNLDALYDAAASAEVDSDAIWPITVDQSGTPTTKYMTGEILKEVIRDEFGENFLTEGANVTITHDDAANTVTVAVTSLDGAPIGSATASTGSFTVNTVDQLVFDITAAIESNAAGEMSWDADAETVMLALDDQIHMHIGQDSFYHVLNQTGSEIPKGTGVYATGTVGNSGKITVAPFTADGTFNSKYFMGVTAEAIANGATGFVVHFGKLRKINTNAFEEGDILFADPSVAGGLTATKPDAPNNIITVAIVVTKSATVGELFVRPTFIDGFADNEDVTVTSATTGDLLRYNGTVWVNYPDSNFASATGLSTHIADTTNPHSVTKTQVGLGNVENTALSTWAGSSNITTLGTIGTGVWQGTAIDSAYIDPTLSVTSVTAGTLSLASGSITDSSGAISFGNENLSTTGNISGATLSATLGVAFSGSAGADGSLGSTSADGVFIRAKAGTTSDWSVFSTGAAGRILYVPTGTSNLVGSGNWSTTGTLASGAATISGSITGSTGGSFNIRNAIDTAEVSVYGGSGSSGANVNLYGGTHPTTANTGRLRIGTGTTVLEWTSSGATVTGTLGVSTGSGDLITASATSSTGYSRINVDNDLSAGLDLLTYGSAYAAGTVYNVGAGGSSIQSSGNLGIRSNGTELALGVGSAEEISITDGAVSITGTLGVSGNVTVNASNSVGLTIGDGSQTSQFVSLNQDANEWRVGITTGEALVIRDVTGGNVDAVTFANASGNATFAGDVTLGASSTTASKRLYFPDTGGNEWLIEYSSGGLQFGEFGVATRLTLPDGGGMTLPTGDVTLSAGDLTVTGQGKFQRSGTSQAYFLVGQTGTADAVLAIDGSNGDGLGGDYFLMRQNSSDLTVDIYTPSGGGSLNLWAGNSTRPNQLTLDTSGNVILGSTSTANNAQFFAIKTYSNASGTERGSFFNYTQSVATTGGLYAQFAQSTASHTSGTVSNIIASVASARATGAGGTTTNLYGTYIQVINSNASAVVDNAYGLYMQGHTATGTITNRWGIYQAGASENNYLAGDLRIGTTSATSHGQESLLVNGSADRLAVIQCSDSSAAYLQFINTTTGSANTDGFIIGISASEQAQIINREATDMLFYTSALERFRVASNAYAIGIGTTDVESWNSSYGAIEIGQGGAIFAPRSSTRAEMYFVANAYYDGSYKYKSSDEVCQFTMFDGYFNWATAQSGTADTVVPFSTKMRLTNGGMLLVGDTANTGMTVGLTINQGANDDEILAFKSSDVAHGITSFSETDTYASFKKASVGNGGLRIDSFTEGNLAHQNLAIVTTVDTTKGTGAVAAFTVDVRKKSGTSTTAMDSNSNLFQVEGNGVSMFIVDQEGDFHYNGADGGAFDAYQDAHLVRAFANATSKETVRTAHDDWVQYNEQTLVDIGVLGAPVSEGGLINGAQLQRVHTGAIWQNYMAISDTKDEVEMLRARLDIAETKLAIAESKLKQLPAA